MDDGRGSFRQLTEEEYWNLKYSPPKEGVRSIFSVGEEVQIKNSHFRIEAIGKKYMRLKLLPAPKEKHDAE